ncbi:quinone oxidoreductase family protein [Jatrophihabitans sp.]|jgi:NADPH2:quinone reductase|uniref:quinone oxidoreductase family protein n=1 Tax=Jatrophihabitans sp. TaxID=1932789 RepID=UPI002F109DB3
MKAVLMRSTGGPEVLAVEQVPEPVPTAGQSLVDVTLAGVNYDDLERRAGDVQPLALPAVLGVDAVGHRRRDGRRVAVLLRAGGGYAQVVVAEDRYTVEVPDYLSDEQAVALLEQGGTAYGALMLAGRLRAGEAVAVSAAAGGVGHLAIQLALALGANPVIGLASTAAKRALVTELGAHRVLDPGTGDLGAQLREASSGGVGLFLDSVGGELTRAALDGLAPFGRLVSIGWRAGGGQAADRCGPVEVSTEALVGRSIGCAGFWMRHVVEDRQLLTGIADELFDLAKRGQLVARIDRTVSLAEVGQAHTALATRATAGKILIDVNREP